VGICQRLCSVLRDNPPPHSAGVTKVTFEAEVGCETVNHPSYSPDLTPVVFSYYDQSGCTLEDRVQTNDELKSGVSNCLRSSAARINYLLGRQGKHVCVTEEYLEKGSLVILHNIYPEARVRFPALPEKKVVGLERGPLSFASTTEELLDRKVAAPV
jgi:hypothetical protein